MAKIYETREDYQRDVLQKQSDRLNLKAQKQDNWATTLIAGSFLADLYHERKPQTRGWLRAVSVVAAIGGMVEWVRSWFTGSKAHDAQLEAERLGPPREIHAFEEAPALAQATIDRALHRHGSHQEVVSRDGVEEARGR